MKRRLLILTSIFLLGGSFPVFAMPPLQPTAPESGTTEIPTETSIEDDPRVAYDIYGNPYIPADLMEPMPGEDNNIDDVGIQEYDIEEDPLSGEEYLAIKYLQEDINRMKQISDKTGYVTVKIENDDPSSWDNMNVVAILRYLTADESYFQRKGASEDKATASDANQQEPDHTETKIDDRVTLINEDYVIPLYSQNDYVGMDELPTGCYKVVSVGTTNGEYEFVLDSYQLTLHENESTSIVLKDKPAVVEEVREKLIEEAAKNSTHPEEPETAENPVEKKTTAAEMMARLIAGILFIGVAGIGAFIVYKRRQN